MAALRCTILTHIVIGISKRESANQMRQATNETASTMGINPARTFLMACVNIQALSRQGRNQNQGTSKLHPYRLQSALLRVTWEPNRL